MVKKFLRRPDQIVKSIFRFFFDTKKHFLANLGIGSYAVHCSLVENDSHLHKNFEWHDGTLIFKVVNVDKELFVGCVWNEMNFSVEKVAG